jgi:hypothetical protein
MCVCVSVCLSVCVCLCARERELKERFMKIKSLSWRQEWEKRTWLHVLVCECVCVWVCACECVNVCVCVYVCVWMWVCVYEQYGSRRQKINWLIFIMFVWWSSKFLLNSFEDKNSSSSDGRSFVRERLNWGKNLILRKNVIMAYWHDMLWRWLAIKLNVSYENMICCWSLSQVFQWQFKNFITRNIFGF